MNRRLEYKKAFADISMFDNGTEVREFHIMIHVKSTRLSFTQQMETVMDAYNQIINP